MVRGGSDVPERVPGVLPPRPAGIPTASERGSKSEVAHKWAKWPPHPCRIGDPHRFRAGGKLRSGPQVGKVGTSPLPYRGSPPLQRGGQNRKWPTSGQNGYHCYFRVCSGWSLLFPSVPWMVIVISWCALDGHPYFLVCPRWSLLFPSVPWMVTVFS